MHLITTATTLLILIPHLTLSQTATPFCTTCKCTNAPDGAPDIDCSQSDIKNYIYEPAFWFSDPNATIPYPIRSLNLQNQRLLDLDAPFPVSNLTKLDLSHNDIHNISAMVFSNLQGLEVLLLGFNNLEVVNGESFRGLRVDARDYPLKALKEFRINDNKLHTLDQDLFEHLDGVEVFDVSNNPLRTIDMPTHVAIDSLAYLKELDLSFTQIKALPEHLLYTPKYLKVLKLSGNLFEEVPQGLGDAHSLETLYFDNNPIGNLTATNGFPKMETLKTLHMCYMPKLYSIGKDSLSGLQNLEELYVTNNLNLSEINPGALSRRDEGAENEIWPPIKKLHLENNKLTSLDFHLIITWESLTELDLRYNAWTCECENQWMVEELMGAYAKINESLAREVTCAAPVEMKGQTFFELHEKEAHMRCLDLYGNRPENDATLLVGVLAGVLVGIPLVLGMMFVYRRHCSSLFDKSPAAFSRQFYSRTNSDDVNF